MRKFVFVLFLILTCGAALTTTSTEAGEIDILLEKLVEKGVLSPLDAQIIKDEAAAEAVGENAEGGSYALPSWVQNMKLKGDLRLRYQFERQRGDSEGRTRGRIRYRVGIESKVGKYKVAAGLASGGSDPRSTNQTLDDSFETGDIRLDYANLEFSPYQNVSIVAGKFKRKPYLWAPTDLLFDSDINPEGGSIHIDHSLTDSIDLFANSGVWVIQEVDGDNDDPFMHYFQGGVKYKEGSVDGKLASTYYGFQGLQGTCPEWSKATNSGVTGATVSSSTGACTGGALMYDFDSVGVSGEVGVKQPFGGLPFGVDDRIAFFGDFIHNVDPDDNANGWAAGMKFGSKKVKKKGTWQAKWLYAYLGMDAWPDFLPDSDRFGGRTDVKGHEAQINYAVANNVILGLDYYNSKRIVGSAGPEHLLQADAVLKF